MVRLMDWDMAMGAQNDANRRRYQIPWRLATRRAARSRWQRDAGRAVQPAGERRTARLSATRIRSRRARLTESESGKARATSGASRTVRAGASLRPGPRATTGNVRKSYSGRSSTRFFELDAFLINLSLAPGRLPSTDDSNGIPLLGVGNHQQ